MFRLILSVVALVGLAACGGGRGGDGGARSFAAPVGGVQSFASGPISAACVRSGRKSASPGLCGCVQAAANLSLTPADQKRGVAYFSDPGKLQEVRQSDSRANEAFWERWSAFSALSESMCSAA